MERTLVLIKPDGVKRRLTGEILSRFERAGLILKGIKIVLADEEIINKHLPISNDWIKSVGNKTLKTYKENNLDAKGELGTEDALEIGKMVRGWLVDYLTGSPLVAIVLEGAHAVENVRKFCGYTIPFTADVGSIRGDFSLDSPIYANAEKRAVENLVHASESVEEAEREIKIWFSPGEIVS